MDEWILSIHRLSSLNLVSVSVDCVGTRFSEWLSSRLLMIVAAGNYVTDGARMFEVRGRGIRSIYPRTRLSAQVYSFIQA
jgi:hypothetical protein